MCTTSAEKERIVPLSRKLIARLLALPAGRVTKWLVLAGWLAAGAVAVPLAGKPSQAADACPTGARTRGAEALRVTGLTDRFPDATPLPGTVVSARDQGITPTDRAKVDA